MRLFDYISRSPNAFAEWALSDKEAGCIDRQEQLYVGLQTQVVLFKTDDDGNPILDGNDEGEVEVHELDGHDVSDELRDDLVKAVVALLNMEVDDDGNPIDI